ncbi:MAG: hypothetical protein ACOVO1_03625 [Chitinophagaceae bacterium]
MKYSQQIGVFAAIIVIVSCYLPWIEITALNKTLNGLDGYVNNNITFGTQIKAHAFFCIFSIPLFIISKVWTKRLNIFICFLNLTWAIKNFILFRLCRPECPETKFGLYLLVLSSVVMMLMALLPKIEVASTPK